MERDGGTTRCKPGDRSQDRVDAARAGVLLVCSDALAEKAAALAKSLEGIGMDARVTSPEQLRRVLEPDDDEGLFVVCVETEAEQRALERLPRSTSFERVFVVLGQGASVPALVFEIEAMVRHRARRHSAVGTLTTSASWGVEVPCPVVAPRRVRSRRFGRLTAAMLGAVASVSVVAAWVGVDSTKRAKGTPTVEQEAAPSLGGHGDETVPMPSDHPPPVLPVRRAPVQRETPSPEAPRDAAQG